MTKKTLSVSSVTQNVLNRAEQLDTIASVLPIDRRDKLAEILTESAWIAEHAAFLFASSDSFRAEVLSAKKDWIERRAQEIADAEADSQATEAAINRWEARNEY